jgi:hypothetical protein
MEVLVNWLAYVACHDRFFKGVNGSIGAARESLSQNSRALDTETAFSCRQSSIPP